MPIPKPESWPNDLNEAAALQEQLAARVALHDDFGPVRHVAGVDVGFEADGTITRAAIAVLAFPELELRDHAIARLPTSFPYIPGYLSFRELPAVLAALEQLHVAPDLLLCDGQGIAHPRRLGIASHLGVVVDLPSIGVAKSILVGAHAALGDERGAWQPLMHRGEQIGAALRTRPGTRPLIISSGHRISLPTALDFVLRCSPRYRLPETTRWAHRLASDKRYRTAEQQIDLGRKNPN